MNTIDKKQVTTSLLKWFELNVKIETQDNMSWVYVKSPRSFVDGHDFLLKVCQEKSPTTTKINNAPPTSPDGIISYNNYINNVFVYKIDQNTESGDIVYKRVFRSLEKKVHRVSDEIVNINFNSMRGKIDEFNDKEIFVSGRAISNVYNNIKSIFSFFLLNDDDIKNGTYQNKVIPNHFQVLLQLLMRDFIDKYIDIQALYRSFSKKVRKNVMHTYNIVSISDTIGKNNLSFKEIDGMPSFTFVFDYNTFFMYVYPYLSKSEIKNDIIFKGLTSKPPFKPPFRYACLVKPSVFPILTNVDNDKFILKLDFLK